MGNDGILIITEDGIIAKDFIFPPGISDNDRISRIQQWAMTRIGMEPIVFHSDIPDIEFPDNVIPFTKFDRRI